MLNLTFAVLRILLVFILWLIYLPSIKSQEVRKIEILHANSLEYDETISGKTRRLIGNVSMMHEGAFMHCDSAHMYSENNSMQAFGHVFMEQGDTLKLWGDRMDYDGNTKKATIWGKQVKLVDKQLTLTTTRIFYDRENEVAHYNEGGKIVDEKTTLISKNGHYFANDKKVIYTNGVVVTNPDYIIRCDTMHYDTKQDISYFFGPTFISGKDSSTIYCEYGWNNNREKKSSFQCNASMQKGKQTMKADTIRYFETEKYGNANCNVSISDSTDNVTLFGDFAFFTEKYNKNFVTQQAWMMKVEDKDTLFLHADTLFSYTPDTTNDKRLIKAWNKVRFFKKDFQGLCDSLTYNQTDSLMRMYQNPVLWNEENQIVADTIFIQLQKKEATDIFLYQSAFITSREDSVSFNQIKGRTMHGFLKENKMYKVLVNGNSQTLYFAREADGSDIGMNTAESSDMLIYIKENKVDRITFLSKPKALMLPQNDVNAENRKLEGFNWFEWQRPSNRYDIFEWKPVKEDVSSDSSDKKTGIDSEEDF